MTFSAIKQVAASIADVAIDDDSVVVSLSDGRTISVPISWYPRLSHASKGERSNWRLIGAGSGIHWPDIDEDVSVSNLLAGQRSGESDTSLKKWLTSRRPS